jgi:hypothetical protein
MYDLSILADTWPKESRVLRQRNPLRERTTAKTLLQRTQRVSTGWTACGSKPGGSEIFRARTNRPCVPPSLLYNGYRAFFPGVKRPGRGVNHPPLSSAEVKERVELYLYSPSGPSLQIIGWPLPLTTYSTHHLAHIALRVGTLEYQLFQLNKK